MVMVMLITCVVLRRLTDEVGFFRAESSSILCSGLVLGNEKENKELNKRKWRLKKTVIVVTLKSGNCVHREGRITQEQIKF